eukprot:SRR837773.904.p2 GENE.SRR837773.904~~SRR837773.904.p2  ORF type:complete len:152 (-),score=24.42 SRR837773.904:93-488(-)
MDDFKQSNGGDDAKLHFEIHGPERAMALIKQDHAAWRRLVDEASPEGMARGHWVRAPENSPAMPKALDVDWFHSSIISGQAAKGPSVFAGMQRLAASAPVLAARSKSRARTALDDQGCTSRAVVFGRRGRW